MALIKMTHSFGTVLSHYTNSGTKCKIS